jgi:hypothetical protein
MSPDLSPTAARSSLRSSAHLGHKRRTCLIVSSAFQRLNLALVGSIVGRPSKASTRHCLFAITGSRRNGPLMVGTKIHIVQRICSAFVTLPPMACSRRKGSASPCRLPDPVCFNPPQSKSLCGSVTPRQNLNAHPLLLRPRTIFFFSGSN